MFYCKLSFNTANFLTPKWFAWIMLSHWLFQYSPLTARFIFFELGLFQSQGDLIICHNQLKWWHWHSFYLAHLPDLSEGVSLSFPTFFSNIYLLFFKANFSFILLTSFATYTFFVFVQLVCVKLITRQSPWAKNQTHVYY